MQDEKLFAVGGDPLRFMDPRFEPVDPVFDADEPAFPRFRRRLKPRSSAAAAAAILTTLACGGSGTIALRESDSILVQLEADAGPPPRTALTGDGPPIVALASVMTDDGPPLLRVPIDPGTDPEVAAENAMASPGVAFAEPVYLYQSSRVPNDPRYKDLWGLAKIRAPDAWARSTGDRAVVVAVIDDGVAAEHPDLAPNLWRNEEEVGNNRQDDDLDGYVDDVNGWDFVDDDPDPSPALSGAERWHGTHVAGTIGASGDNRVGVAGVNWKVSLMPLRAIGTRGGRSDQLAKAIDFAADHGARVINASWGGNGTSAAIANAIARANRKGVLFVAAAGNDSSPSPSFPANLKIENLLSVGATTFEDRLASFSDRGAMVAAPGVGILSTTAPGRYEAYDGTSMAAPHVAGLAALLWSVHPKATLAQVKKAIVASAVPVRGVQNGRVDASRALALLDEETGTSGGALRLSREELKFTVRPGRVPRAQAVTVHAERGGAVAVSAASDSTWVVVPKTQVETPARVAVRIDPHGLSGGTHRARVTFTSEDGAVATLSVTAQVGEAPAVSVQGEGCSVADGKLRARAGAGCTLIAVDGEAAGIQWTLPGGVQVGGGRLYGQFMRRGEFQLTVSADEGVTDAVGVVIE
jgi:subtilisin family serine protease